MTRLSVVIAAFDERASIEELTRRLHSMLVGLAGFSWELVYVVEGQDGTREILERLAAELGGRFRILYRQEPSGLGDAFKRGFAAVAPDADLVVTLDADLNHQPEEIPRLIAAQRRSGCDVVVGSRFLAASRVEGTPAWKRFLSGTMNFLMRFLYGVRVLDKTSGFRVYRAAALRAIEFTNPAFAFLPEILIRAHQEGLRIEEEPIHFVYRTEGRSKLQIIPTTLSYLTLLRTRFDRWSLAVVVLLLAGLAVRVAMAYPADPYPADADCLLEGLCANRVLRGEMPVFFSGFRLGSLECYLTAALFALFGVSRSALALGPVIVGAAFQGVAYRLTRLLLGRQVAAVTLVFWAIPPPAVLFWTYMPNAYPMVMLLCAAILWLAVELAHGRPPPWAVFAFGLVAGLGFWHSFQTLSCLVPALVWLAWRRPDLVRNWKLEMLGLAGFLLGAFPWIAFNGLYGLPSFSMNFAAKLVSGPAAVWSNAEHFVRAEVPELLASLDPRGRPLPPGPLKGSWRMLILATYGVAALWFLAAPFLGRRRGRRPAVTLSPWLLLAGVALTVFALKICSAAGEQRGLTVRYIMPLFLVAAPVVALFLTAMARRGGRWGTSAAVVLAAAIVLFNLAAYRWPGDSQRLLLAADGRHLGSAMEVFEEEDVQAVLGGYWVVYPINFLSAERVIGIPCAPGEDMYDYVEKLPDPVERWILLGRAPEREWLADWAARAGVAGEVRNVAPGYIAFQPRAGAISRAELQERVQAACRPRQL